MASLVALAAGAALGAGGTCAGLALKEKQRAAESKQVAELEQHVEAATREVACAAQRLLELEDDLGGTGRSLAVLETLMPTKGGAAETFWDKLTEFRGSMIAGAAGTPALPRDALKMLKVLRDSWQALKTIDDELAGAEYNRTARGAAAERSFSPGQSDEATVCSKVLVVHQPCIPFPASAQAEEDATIPERTPCASSRNGETRFPEEGVAASGAGKDAAPIHGQGYARDQVVEELQSRLDAAVAEAQRREAAMKKEVSLVAARESEVWRSKNEALQRRLTEQSAAFDRERQQLQQERDNAVRAAEEAAKQAAIAASAASTGAMPHQHGLLSSSLLVPGSSISAVNGPMVFQIGSDDSDAEDRSEVGSVAASASGRNRTARTSLASATRVLKGTRRSKRGGRKGGQLLLVPARPQDVQLVDRPGQEEMDMASLVGATSSQLRMLTASGKGAASGEKGSDDEEEDFGKVAVSVGSFRSLRVVDASRLSCGVVSMRHRKRALMLQKGGGKASREMLMV